MQKVIFAPVALTALCLASCQSTPRPELRAAVVATAATHATLPPDKAQQCVDDRTKGLADKSSFRIIQEPVFAPGLTYQYGDRLTARFPDEPELAKRLAVYRATYEWEALFGLKEFKVACFYEIEGTAIRYLENRVSEGDRVNASVGSLYRSLGGKNQALSYFVK